MERRLYICDTKELEEKVSETRVWIEKSAMRCLLWMAKFLNGNVEHVEQEERFYELPINVSSDVYIKRSV